MLKKYSNKILFLLLIFLLILLSFARSSFATVDYFGKQFPEFPEGWEEAKYKIIIYYPNQDKYQLFFWNKEGCIFVPTVDDYYKTDYPSLFIPGGYFRYEWQPNSITNWVFTENNNINFNFFNWDKYPTSNTNALKTMVYSNFSIPIVGSDEYFFYKTPLVNFSNMQLSYGGTAWQTVMYITIMILVVVVSYLGLRKGLQMLLTLLRRS